MVGITLAEHGLVPAPLLRRAIRSLLARRLADERRRHEPADAALGAFVERMRRAPIALVPELANGQHYEVPAELYKHVLGRNLKYSSALWPDDVTSLDDAETAMLELTAERAGLRDGQRILELGCGWGSLTVHMARRYPAARIVAVSNSRSQREVVEARAAAAGCSNVTVLTEDMNQFAAPGRFDRIVSVEMFEHMRNWEALLTRARTWLEDDGALFLHVFAHRAYAYTFETDADDDWMGRHFFSGGMMPSVDLVDRLTIPFAVEARWIVDGTHYARTAEAWLRNLEARRTEVDALFRREQRATSARRTYERWRLFFLACAELFAWNAGTEWVVAHYRLAPERGGAR